MTKNAFKFSPASFQSAKTCVFALCSAVMLGACQPTALSGPTPSETIARNEVKMVRIPHSIQAEDDGTDTPSTYTLNGINLFLKSVSVGYGDLLLLDTSAVAPARAKAIEAYLIENGYPYGGHMPLGAEPPLGSLTLYVERHIVVPPECGKWGKQDHENNNASSHLGCATAANLGLMVANPRDLILGQSTSNSTAAAVGAIYTPTPQNTGPSVTLSFEGLPDTPAPTARPVPNTSSNNQ